MRKQLKKCPICQNIEFIDLDYLRDWNYWYSRDYILAGEKIGFKICKECGFLTYDYPDDLVSYYTNERKCVNFLNLLVGNRRNEYKRIFLSDVLQDKPRDINILDIGTGTGQFLGLLTSMGFTNLYATEYSTPFLKFVQNTFPCKATKEIDVSVKYDFISYYRVLEHIPNPVLELMQIRELLNDDGLLYISIPIWGEILDDTMDDTIIDSWENYYHLNHVNVFSRTSLKNVLQVAGFEVIKFNDTFHGITILCKKGKGGNIIKEPVDTIIKTLESEKEAVSLFIAHKFDEATTKCPKYPDAWIHKTLKQDVAKDFDLQMKILSEAVEVCGPIHKLLNQIAKVHFQWDQGTPEKQWFYGNNIRRAEELFKTCITLRPGNEDALYFLSIIEAKYKKDVHTGVALLNEFVRINPQKWSEAVNMIGNYWKEYTSGDNNATASIREGKVG